MPHNQGRALSEPLRPAFDILVSGAGARWRAPPVPLSGIVPRVAASFRRSRPVELVRYPERPLWEVA